MSALRKTCVLLSLVAMMASPMTARADDDDVTEYSFGDELVRGDLVRPDGEVFQVRRRGSRRSLIRPRASFVPELYKCVENI